MFVRRRRAVYSLCDLDWVVSKFKNDFAFEIMLAHLNAKTKNPELAYADTLKLGHPRHRDAH